MALERVLHDDRRRTSVAGTLHATAGCQGGRSKKGRRKAASEHHPASSAVGASHAILRMRTWTRSATDSGIRKVRYTRRPGR